MIDHFVKYWVSKPSERALNIKWSTFILDKKNYILKDSELDDVLFLKKHSADEARQFVGQERSKAAGK